MTQVPVALLRLEGENIDVVPNTKEGKQGFLSDNDLDVLMDCTLEMFAKREYVWISGAGLVIIGHGWIWRSMTADGEVEHAAIAGCKKAASAVYQATVEVEEDNNLLVKENVQ